MRYFLFILLLLPVFSFAQKRADYEQMMDRFMKNYNAGQGDSVLHMWPAGLWDLLQGGWTPAAMKKKLDEYGKMKSFTYLGVDETDPDKVVAFKTVFTKAGSKVTSLTIMKNTGELGDFRFITTSPEIEKMLKKKK